jgi:putative ABC transport system permease protein
MGAFWQDLRYAGRMLCKSPGFTAVAVLTLGLGIGANAAIFSVVNGVLLHRMPYGDADRLNIIWNDYGSQGQSLPAVSPPDFQDYKQRSRLMEFAAAGGTPGGTLLFRNPDGSNRPEQFDMAAVTTDFFPLFGIRPILGRNFSAEEGAVNGPKVVILSYLLWQRSFHSDPGLVGRAIQLNGESFTVVGILPREFRLLLPAEAFKLRDSELWVPQQLNYSAYPRNLTFLTVFARRKPGVTLAQAQAEMDGIAEQLRNENEVHKESGLRIRVVPLQFDVVKNVRSTLVTLLGAVAFVLLIACGNVANLLLARATGREREMAIRAALGASRSRLIGQIAIESVLLAILGGAAGLLLASWGLDLLLALHPAGLPRLNEIHIDRAVLGFSLGLSLLTALLFGLVPAIQETHLNLSDTLKESGRSTGTARSQGVRRMLVVTEFSLSLVLLIGAGLLIRSFIALQRVQPGFDSGNVITFRLTLPEARYPKNEDINRFRLDLERKLTALPGVRSVGATEQLPLTGSGPMMPYAYDEQTSQKWESLSADFRAISPGYFPSIGARLLSGRLFNEADDAHHPRVLIVDQTLAQRAWPGQDAVGKKLQIDLFDPPGMRGWTTVVGVVANVRNYDLARDVREQIYIPYAQHPESNFAVTVKTRRDTASVLKQVKQQVQALDSSIAVRSLMPMDRYVSDARAPMRFNLILIGTFGAIALVLASVGLYGLMAYSVSQRMHELGIRMALGAAPRDVLRLILGQGVRMTLFGAALGLLVSLAVTRALASLLVGVSATDPLTFAIVPIVLAAVAFLACYIPARRAMRVDPMVALRYE